ncbi:MAG: universal stress protein [Terriglobia bacterium]
MFQLKKILLPVDFSNRCLEAVRYALPSLAKHFQSEIFVCHVLPPYLDFGSPELGVNLSGEFAAERRKEGKAQLENFLAGVELQPVPSDTVLRGGRSGANGFWKKHSHSTVT